MIDQAFCSKCGAARGAGAFCSSCGTAFASPVAAGPPGWVTPSATPKKKGRNWAIPLVVVAVLLIAYVGNQSRASTPGSPSRTAAPVAPNVHSWSPPDGFVKTSQDPSVAFRWLDSVVCDLADRCWGMELVANDGCPGGLYVELTTLASDGAAVGFTNDTVGSVSPGGKARMIFDNFEPTAHKARLADVSCN